MLHHKSCALFFFLSNNNEHRHRRRMCVGSDIYLKITKLVISNRRAVARRCSAFPLLQHYAHNRTQTSSNSAAPAQSRLGRRRLQFHTCTWIPLHTCMLPLGNIDIFTTLIVFNYTSPQHCHGDASYIFGSVRPDPRLSCRTASRVNEDTWLMGMSVIRAKASGWSRRNCLDEGGG